MNTKTLYPDKITAHFVSWCGQNSLPPVAFKTSAVENSPDMGTRGKSLQEQGIVKEIGITSTVNWTIILTNKINYGTNPGVNHTLTNTNNSISPKITTVNHPMFTNTPEIGTSKIETICCPQLLAAGPS